jgi:hypothetical protein
MVQKIFFVRLLLSTTVEPEEEKDNYLHDFYDNFQIELKEYKTEYLYRYDFN